MDFKEHMEKTVQAEKNAKLKPQKKPGDKRAGNRNEPEKSKHY